MNDSMRHLVVATDERFLMPTATTLRSLSTHDPGPITVWILATGVSDLARRKVRHSLVGQGTRLEWIDMDSADFGDTSANPLGRASYFRLAVGEVLPEHVDRVLYMDTDMLVRDTLSPLWDLAESGVSVWAVRSVHFPHICSYGAVDHWPELALDPRAPYFNSGLLMIDLQEWRARDVGRRCLKYLASSFANRTLADQEALNVVLAGRWREIEPRWNQQTPFLEHNRGVQVLYTDEVIREARERPAVIHFLNRPKPWQVGCTHPWRESWLSVANETQFAPVFPSKEPIMRQATWRLKRAASALIKGR